jgi:hypothetical protein
LLIRSPVAPTRTTDATATALTQVKVYFIGSLVPRSAAAAVLDLAIQASFANAASISIPGITLPTAGWIGEGQAIPVLQGTVSNATLTPSKLAAIIVLTNEMVDGSDAETIMETVLIENIGASLDAVFFTNAAAVAGVSPPGILNGAISVTPSPAGQNAMAQDLGKLAAAVAPVSGNAQMVIAAAPAQAAIIRAVSVDPPPTYSSNALPDGTVVGIVPVAIATANDTPVISVSRETTFHMAAPASDIVSSPGTVASPSRSVFQTNSLALRFTQDMTWAKRGPGVAMITGANWP